MNTSVLLSCALLALAVSTRAGAAEVDTRPPNKLTVTGSGSKQKGVDHGGSGSLNYLHYLTPDAVFGIGGEHQFIADAEITFGTLRGAYGFGDPGARTTIYADGSYGDGDDDGRDFDYSVYTLGVSQSITPKFAVELENRYFDIHTSHGSLPKLGLTYVWTPNLLTYLSYANSVSGNLGTELTSARIELYTRPVNVKIGGSRGKANPAVIDLTSDIARPAVKSRQAFVSIGRTFRPVEVQLIGDYLKTGDAKKYTVTLSLTTFLGSRGRAP